VKLRIIHNSNNSKALTWLEICSQLQSGSGRHPGVSFFCQCGIV